jgi:hypothetical protein
MSLDLNKLSNKLDEALIKETSETLSKFLNDKRMTNNKQQTAVEWLIEKCACADLRPELWEIIKQQAKEMEVMGKEMSYSDGYAQGYQRALDYISMSIENAKA